MPEDYLSSSGTLWMNVTNLEADADGTDYNMFAYTRMRATPDTIFDINATFFSGSLKLLLGLRIDVRHNDKKEFRALSSKRRCLSLHGNVMRDMPLLIREI